MKYYRVKKTESLKFSEKQRIIKDELFTEYEVERFMLPFLRMELVEIEVKKTVIKNGIRIEEK